MVSRLANKSLSTIRVAHENVIFVLADHKIFDGERTIMKFHSKKIQTVEGWQHTKIELVPLNKKYDVIEIDGDSEYLTVGVLKYVIDNNVR